MLECVLSTHSEVLRALDELCVLVSLRFLSSLKSLLVLPELEATNLDILNQDQKVPFWVSSV